MHCDVMGEVDGGAVGLKFSACCWALGAGRWRECREEEV